MIYPMLRIMTATVHIEPIILQMKAKRVPRSEKEPVITDHIKEKKDRNKD
jgi:hypothetical protein